jgi:hypothetical protein
MVPMIEVAFTPREAGELTGLSRRRLRDWRRAGIFLPQPIDRDGHPDERSFPFSTVRDLVGLRALARLRPQNVPLQELHGSQPWLWQHEATPWTDLRLVTHGRTICLDPPQPAPGRAATPDRTG